MDKFRSNIKAKYESQIHSDNVDEAWESFEMHYLSDRRRRPKVFWLLQLLIICGVVSYTLFNSNHQQTTTPVDLPPVVENVEEEIESHRLALPSILHSDSSKQMISVESERIIDFDQKSGDIYSEVGQLNNVRNSKIALNKSTIASFHNNQQHPTSSLTVLLGNKRRPNNQLKTRQLQLLQSIPRRASYIESVSINIDSQLLMIPHNDDKQSISRLSIGIIAGANSLYHRYIYKSIGANIGVIGNIDLIGGFSFRSQFSLSSYNVLTAINSHDLRISGIELRESSMVTEQVQKDLLQINSSISIVYSIIDREKWHINIGAGIQQKVDLKHKNTYTVSTGIDQFVEVEDGDSNYKYPIFNFYSAGIGIKIDNRLRLNINSYLSKKMRSGGLNHPHEVGTNVEVLYHF